jgi:ribosomal protein S18 acetylase RimI-like enzyme
MVTIRPFEDADVIVAATAFAEAYAQPPWQEQWLSGNAQERLTQLLENSRFVGYVAVLDGDVCGGICGHFEQWAGGMECILDEIWVAPHQQQQGFGTLLLEQLVEEGASRGAQGITLWTHRLAPAIHLYRSAGFKAIEERRFYRRELRSMRLI